MANKIVSFAMILISAFTGLLLTEGILIALKEEKQDVCGVLKKEMSENARYSAFNAQYEPNKYMPICSKEFNEEYISDENGYLGFPSKGEIDESLLVFGDSFAYGFGVNQQKTIAANLGAYNAGLWGRSFNDHAKAFRKITSIYKFDKAVWVIYAPHLITISKFGWNTTTNVNKENKVLYKVVEAFNKTEISRVLLKTFGIGWNRGDYYTPEWSLYDNTSSRASRGYKIFDESLMAINEVANKNNIKMYFFIVPSKVEMRIRTGEPLPPFVLLSDIVPDLPSKRLTKAILSTGHKSSSIIYMRDLLINNEAGFDNWKNYYFDIDAHINTKGSMYVANYLKEIIVE